MNFHDLIALAPAGDRIELGVCRGDSLRFIAAHPGLTFGVDSFEGMGDPTPRDIMPDGRNPYPRGRLREPLAKIAAKFPNPKIRLVKGWVPDVLQETLLARPYAFAHVDLDHYTPTVAALDWLWGRMLPGGVLVCDDWFEGKDYLAAGAINERAKVRPFAGTIERKAYWIF